MDCRRTPNPQRPSESLGATLRQEFSLAVHPDVGAVPRLTPSGAYFVPGACPGEYCRYGEWALDRGVTLRRAPSLHADSIGFVPASRAVCADSGLVIVDPPGIVLITAPPPQLDFSPYPPAFAPGDTLLVLNYRSEGYWNVRWRDSITPTYAYWDGARDRGARVVRAPRNFWWVHVTDRGSGSRGWFLMEGVDWVSDERPAPCA